MSDFRYLVCLDMDRVLVDHLSTWQFVYDKLGISNDESFELYNQGLLNEWDWIKLDIALIKSSIRDRKITDSELRSLMEGMPMMNNWHLLISELIKDGAKVAIVSGGLQQTARDIAAQFPSNLPWSRRWGGIDRFTAERYGNGFDTKLSVFTNGWLRGNQLSNGMYELDDFGRYQVQMNGKGAIVKMLQRRYNISKNKTISVGDSAGDIGMFQEADLAICFNPWDERPLKYCDEVIEEKDLALVLNLIKAKMND
ncbi:MAG: HAD hydrolase family protein [Candidatus Poseidoniaceae archaeon]|nr:HAD hydrolase family protein [Candidatus Poseidoniaceae archaeon]MBL6896466.1 HAD hydrolase family protein [Candidatus Poseidoniaceae archaeon]